MEQRDRRGLGRHRRRRLNQGRCSAGLLGEDGRRTLLLLEERGGGKNPGASGIVLFLHGGGNHGVEFLPELGDLGSLAGVIGGHRRWCRGAVTGDAAEGERAVGH
jgi:hypothetical protein